MVNYFKKHSNYLFLDMNDIRRLFEQKVALSDLEWQRFAEALQQIELPRKTLLLQKGKVENYLSFIEEG